MYTFHVGEKNTKVGKGKKIFAVNKWGNPKPPLFQWSIESFQSEHKGREIAKEIYQEPSGVGFQDEFLNLNTSFSEFFFRYYRLMTNVMKR